ncbi:hypothetical protein LXJ59_28895, partial [Escherichia coli]|nr:hypothetical protein [Escherichia coli]
TATQSLNDYYKSDGSKAALENSDWFVILQQKAETIADFKKHDRFEMDDHTDALLRSLKRQGFEYSDVLIKGPDMLASGGSSSINIRRRSIPPARRPSPISSI